MKNRKKPLRTLVSAAVIGILTTQVADAAGFSLYGEGAGYTAGNYGAGTAAEAADASIGWYNPAGLSLLRDQQLVLGGVGIFPDIRINGTSTYTTTGLPDYVQHFKDVDGSYSGFVPSGHYALPIGDHTTLGLSLTAPYGLSTDWDPDSPVRYAATYTQVLTSTLSPEIGSQLFEHFALGVGIDFQYASVKFNQIVGAPTIFDYLTDGASPTSVDTYSNNKGSSWGLGFHVGVMSLFHENHTRIGLNYQSRVRHVFNGTSQLKGILANNFDLVQPTLPGEGVWSNSNLSSNPIEFPDVLTLSGYQDVTDKLAVLGSVVYQGWNVFKTIQLNNVVVPEVSATPPFPVSETSISNIVPQNFSNVWRVALGANYHFNQKWMLRVGAGYDQTPTNNTDRNTRLPDVDRWAIAVGSHYQMRPNLGFDLGYTHLFSASNASIDATQQLSATSTYNVNSPNGHFSADLVGGQVTWIIDKIPKAKMK